MATTGAKAPRDDNNAQAAGAEGLESDIRQLRDDIALLTQHLKDTSNRSMSRARQAAMERADNLRGTAEELQDDVVEAVREKPLTALTLAAGFGMLLAMIMRR